MKSMTTDPSHRSPRGSPFVPSSSRLHQVCFCRWAASRGGVATKVYSFTCRGSQAEQTEKHLQERFLGLRDKFGFEEILLLFLLAQNQKTSDEFLFRQKLNSYCIKTRQDTPSCEAVRNSVKSLYFNVH